MNPLNTFSICFSLLNTDTKMTKEKMMLTTDHSKTNVMLILRLLTKKSLHLKLDHLNSKVLLIPSFLKETPRKDLERLRFSEETKSKLLLMKIPTTVLQKLIPSKERDSNTNMLVKDSNKPEESSPITLLLHHSSNQLVLLRTSPKSSPKLLLTFPLNQANSTTSSTPPTTVRPSRCSLN